MNFLVDEIRRVHAGVILLRLAGLSAEAKCDHVLAVPREALLRFLAPSQ